MAFTDPAKASGLAPSWAASSTPNCNSADRVVLVADGGRTTGPEEWKTRIELANAMFDYLEIWQNRRRRQTNRLAGIHRVRTHQHHHHGMRIQNPRLRRTRGTPASGHAGAVPHTELSGDSGVAHLRGMMGW